MNVSVLGGRGGYSQRQQKERGEEVKKRQKNFRGESITQPGPHFQKNQGIKEFQVNSSCTGKRHINVRECRAK